MRNLLWSQLPNCTKPRPIAPILYLCKGLPVVIKTNIATELCITNGQEGLVYDWQESISTLHNRPYLTPCLLLY